MGTITAKEKIESKMLMLKLKKIQIRRERIDRIKQLKALTGKEIIRETIPDYIDRDEDKDDAISVQWKKDNNNKSIYWYIFKFALFIKCCSFLFLQCNIV